MGRKMEQNKLNKKEVWLWTWGLWTWEESIDGIITYQRLRFYIMWRNWYDYMYELY